MRVPRAGYCEASGKSAGGNGLDGLSIGCDHNGVFYLTGSLAELRLFHCHMTTAQRVQTEVNRRPSTYRARSPGPAAPPVAPSRPSRPSPTRV